MEGFVYRNAPLPKSNVCQQGFPCQFLCLSKKNQTHAQLLINKAFLNKFL